jgi:hypothetical protein
MLWLTRKKVDVLNHWIAFADGFNMPAKEFYDQIEAKLKKDEIPEMSSLRVAFSEGGLLSDNRTYLRFTRESLVFDICACPFGRDFFFSCRTATTPIGIWEFLLCLFLFAFGSLICFSTLGIIRGSIAILTGVILFFLFFRNAKSLDATLMETPVIRAAYVLIRPETYYREDTRLMYLDLISRVVKEAAEDVTAAKGLKLAREYIHAPVLGAMYRPVYNDLLVVQKAEDAFSPRNGPPPVVGL